MKSGTVRAAHRMGVVLGLWLVAVAPAISGETTMPSPVGPPPELGTHTLLTQADGRGESPAVTAAITTREQGSSLLLLSAGFASNHAEPSDSYGNRWLQQGPAAVYDGYEGRFDVRAYVVPMARGGRNHRVSIDKPGQPQGEITVPFVEIRHAGVLQDMAQNYPQPGVIERTAGKFERAMRRLLDTGPPTSSSVTSGEVTTTGPAVLVAVWWGDAFVLHMSAAPDNGFRVIDQFLQLPPESGVQCVVAVRQVDRAGTWNVTWTGSPAQRAILWLFAFQAAPVDRSGGR